MQRILAPLCGLVLVAGCSTVPMQTTQPVTQVQSTCDYALMDRIDRARQPVLLARYWVNCPQLHENAKS
ncbi:MAG TPA: hypothetical protein VG429_02105 [Casimicrobiaceae bacterium]|jgi:hypothetical protein|nr:hypothetical protein [Casimicrobiaceae bacterium]